MDNARPHFALYVTQTLEGGTMLVALFWVGLTLLFFLLILSFVGAIVFSIEEL